MPITILRGSDDLPLAPLRKRVVAVIGYGNQGRAHALNLRDSGIETIVGNRPGSANADQCEADGFQCRSPADAATHGDLIILAVPDEVQPEVFHTIIRPNVRAGAVVGFLTGYALRFEQIIPPESLGIVMVAPKGPGATLRARYEMGQGIPCLFAVHQESPTEDTRAIGLAWAAAIGAGRAGVIETTVAHEAEVDLFGEQTVLCGGMTSLIIAAFELLVEQGYPPELAYMECCHEVKQVADLVYERGLAGMMQAISNTAEFGAHAIGPVVVDEHVRETMKKVLQDVRTGDFARRFTEDHQQGFPWFEAQRAALADHPIEDAGRVVRSLMPWLTADPPTS